MIERYIQLITGFGQDPLNLTGLEEGTLELNTLFGSGETYISIAEWGRNMRKLAARINRMCAKNAQIIIIAYSWGVGRGAVQLAKHLRKYGRKVVVFAIDGVYHSFLFFWRAIWSGLSDKILGEPEIVFPDNVEYCEMWRQRQNVPKGHPIRLTREGAVLFDHGFLSRNHEAMDEADTIWERIREWIEESGDKP